MSGRILRILIAFDILVFALMTFGGARRNETISAALWSLEGDGKLMGRIFRPVVDLMFSPFQKDHCANAWLSER